MKDLIGPKEPPQRNRHKQLQTHNVPIYDVENINSTNKGRDLLLVNKLQIVSQGTEKMAAAKDPEAEESYSI